jgi:hypothetical protein
MKIHEDLWIVAKFIGSFILFIACAIAVCLLIANAALCAAQGNTQPPAPGYCVRHEGLTIERGVHTVRQTHIECPPASASDRDISMVTQ